MPPPSSSWAALSPGGRAGNRAGTPADVPHADGDRGRDFVRARLCRARGHPPGAAAAHASVAAGGLLVRGGAALGVSSALADALGRRQAVTGFTLRSQTGKVG